MIKSVFGYTWIKESLSTVTSTEQSQFKTLPSLVGCNKVSLTELLPQNADLIELGRKAKDYRVRRNDSLSCTEHLWRRTLMKFFKQIGKIQGYCHCVYNFQRAEAISKSKKNILERFGSEIIHVFILHNKSWHLPVEV